MPDHADSCLIVRNYLSAMESRKLDLAKTYLAPDFSMTFPGGYTFRTPEELIDWARHRYQSVGKNYEQFDQCAGSDECVVYCFGTLHGIWLDGTAFEGIRFIDRFVLIDRTIHSQMVWNDLAVKPVQNA